MTIDEFLDHLEKTTRERKLKWQLIGPYIRTYPNLFPMCPITCAVGQDIFEYSEVGIAMGLSRKDIQSIIEATDLSQHPVYEERPGHEYLRGAILKRCGLRPETIPLDSTISDKGS